MSVEIYAYLICDGCGAKLSGPVERTTTLGNNSYWQVKKESKRLRWVELSRYGPRRHYCNSCADKPLKKAVAKKGKQV